MKVSKRFKRSTIELSILMLLVLDGVWWTTGLIAGLCVLCLLGQYLWYRREAVLNVRASESIRSSMTLAGIKEIERTYTMRDDYNSAEKRAMVRPPLDRHFYHDRYAQVRRLLERYARDARSVLDVGCGFGRNTAFIASTLGGNAFGIDIDSLKLVEARRRLIKGGLAKGCAFVCADAAQPPFKSSTFDCVLITEVLEHLISPKEGLLACRAVLRDGGLLIITAPGSHHLAYTNNPFIIAEKLLSLLSDRVLPPYPDLHAEREYDRRRPEPQYGIHYHFSMQQLDALLKSAGFETILHEGFEFEIYPYLIIELLTRGRVEQIAKWISLLEALLQRIPGIHHLGQHLICVARKL